MPIETQLPGVKKSKKIFFLFASLLIIYLIYFIFPKSTISVLGTGTIAAQPNMAQFAVTVAALEGTSQSAMSQARNKVDTLIDTLKTQGLTDQDIKIAPYNSTFTATGEALNYVAGTTILVTSNDVILTNTLVEMALYQGARLSQPITYQAKNQKELELQAKEIAIKDAREKAKGVASTLNKRLGKIVSYSETSPANSQGSSLFTSSDNSIELTQTVEVTFQTR